jgi:Holliday junction resolvasome RuvABC endonuclease subunit
MVYKYNSRGQLQLQGKQSPDKADALAIAFAAT